ncbi:phytanoyl-CoA dioxygenase family protein [Paraburkholderia sp. BR13439]|uniref:phytanoyl-CoA dioxygenase family protein n=1 Tax=Paraburkholderia sp. BR13439 TaxID=3236996 RepID=UPI0034CD1F5C
MRDDIRRRNGVLDNSAGTLHHLLMDDPCYVELLAEFSALEPVFKRYFGGNFILNSYGGVINERDSRSYVQNVHRDIRFGSDTRRFMVNALLMLDDFTLENGATHILSRSQNVQQQPADEDFYAHASRATGERGSVLLFDSRMWHATGRNTTNAPRRALTLTFTSPFFKPQLDYARLFGYRNLDRCNAWMRQVLGFNARVPESLDEFYVPVEQRFYQRGQD